MMEEFKFEYPKFYRWEYMGPTWEEIDSFYKLLEPVKEITGDDDAEHL